MIAKNDLVHGTYYHGERRGGDVARWDAQRGVFRFHTIDCGHRVVREVPHPDDEHDQHWDVFTPLYARVPTDTEIPID